MAWPPTLGGLIATGRSVSSFLLPAVRLLVPPGLAEVLHAEGAVVGSVALPAGVHLVLALVFGGTGGPLGTQRLLGGVDLVLQRGFLLLVWNLRERGHRLHKIGRTHFVAPESKS